MIHSKNDSTPIREFVENDFSNEMNEHERIDSNNHNWNDYIATLSPYDLYDDKTPDWLFEKDSNDFTAEEEEAYCEECSRLRDEYREMYYEMYYKWREEELNDIVQEYDSDENRTKYNAMKSEFERGRNSYYGYCMNGGGGKKGFSKMYGDGNYYTYAEWLEQKYK